MSTGEGSESDSAGEEVGEVGLGGTRMQRPAELLEALQDHVKTAANGVLYVTKDVRTGVLPTMLSEVHRLTNPPPVSYTHTYIHTIPSGCLLYVIGVCVCLCV